MKAEPIIIDFERPDDTAGWLCPRCGGWGKHMDGSATFSEGRVVIQPATKCGVCNGYGRVNVTPIETAK